MSLGAPHLRACSTPPGMLTQEHLLLHQLLQQGHSPLNAAALCRGPLLEPLKTLLSAGGGWESSWYLEIPHSILMENGDVFLFPCRWCLLLQAESVFNLILPRAGA